MKLTPRTHHIGLAFLALLGFVFTLVTTWKFGAGVSSDAVRAMAAAENLLAGKGFVDNIGAPYVHWPPLYPLILAGLSFLTRLDVFHVGWFLNLILFPLNIILWGRLLERIFPENLHYALWINAASVISTSMLRIYANIASDPLFVTTMILFFLVAADYLEAPSSRSLWWMFIIAGLSILQRYLGVVLAGSVLGFSAYMVLLQRIGTALASSYSYVNPVIGLLLGATLGGEAVAVGEWAAAVVVLAGVVLLLAGRR